MIDQTPSSSRTRNKRALPQSPTRDIDDLGYGEDGIVHVTARFGYMETPGVPATLALLDPADTEGVLDLDRASYFLSKIELRRGKQPTMATWRKRLFIATSYITADAVEHVGLPPGPDGDHGVAHRGVKVRQGPKAASSSSRKRRESRQDAVRTTGSALGRAIL
ncbi:KUP/HAK/KT family potassium transporter [Kitasatospora phosalacinea]|nr:hypothetical protein [Kitasatospora phosalacinea]